MYQHFLSLFWRGKEKENAGKRKRNTLNKLQSYGLGALCVVAVFYPSPPWGNKANQNFCHPELVSGS